MSTITVRGGDIRQLTIDNREYDPAPDTSFDLDLGGFENDFALNGNGTGHLTQKRRASGFGGGDLSIDDTRQDLESLQAVANGGKAVTVTLSLPSGVTYSGSLAIVGELKKKSKDGTLPIEMRGERFEQI